MIDYTIFHQYIHTVQGKEASKKDLKSMEVFTKGTHI